MKKKRSRCKRTLSNLGNLTSQHMTVVDKKFIFCLVCKEALLDHDPVSVSSHELSSNHQENLKILFKICVPDIRCDSNDANCTKIISNAKFDIPLLLKKGTSYLHQFENHLVCLLCQDIVSQVANCKDTEVKCNLVSHLESNQHLNRIKQNICLVYFLKSNNGFFMFHKTVMFCSICKETYSSCETALLQCIVHHMKTEHPNEVDSVNENINCHKENVRTLTYMCIDTVQIYSADTPGTINNGDNWKNEYPNYTEECNGLVCLVCGEDIEMYNSIEFSVDLHMQKHNSYSSDDLINLGLNSNLIGDELYCPICQEEVLLVNKDIELSINLHGCSLTETECSLSKDKVNGNSSTVAKLFKILQDDLKVHQNFIQIYNNDIFCELCNCKLSSGDDLEKACEIVKDHVSHVCHEEQYKVVTMGTTNVCHEEQYNMFTMSTTASENSTKDKEDPWELFKDNNNLEEISLLESVIEKNHQYIGEGKNFYFCKICECCFLSFGNEQELMRILASHFLCKNHKKKFKRYLGSGHTNSDTGKVKPIEICNPISKCNNGILFAKLKNLRAFHMNSQYLTTKETTVFCELCQICITNNNDKKLVTKHFYSESHNMILVQNAANYIENVEKKQLLNYGDVRHKKFVNILKIIAETHYKMNNPTITPNLMYISSNGATFLCILCNMPIGFSQSGSVILDHFSQTAHKENTYKLNCSDISFTHGRNSSNLSSCSFSSLESNNLILNKEERPSTCEKEQKNTDIEVSAIFEQLPVECRLYRDFITMDGDIFYCQLCSVTLLSKKNFQADYKILENHMSSPSHKEQYQLLNTQLASSGGDLDPWDLFNDADNFEITLQIQRLNEINREYIDFGEIHFRCNLCYDYFLYFDDQDMMKTIASHCLTKEHIKYVKSNPSKLMMEKNFEEIEKVSNYTDLGNDSNSLSTLPDNLSLKNDIKTILKKVTRSPFMMLLNKHYLSEKENTFFCNACQVLIKFTETGSNVKKHCYSKSHNVILVKNSINYVVNCNPKETSQNPPEKEEKFKNVLKTLARTSYKEKRPIATSHLFLISNNQKDFVCRLCDKEIRFVNDGKTIMHHFLTKLHRENTYKLNCSYRSTEPVNYSDSMQETSQTSTQPQAIIEENQKYIKRGKFYYYCQICDLYFLYFGVGCDFRETVLFHCRSKSHLRNIQEFYGEMEESSCVSIATSIQKFSNVSVNQATNAQVKTNDLETILHKFRNDPAIMLNSQFFNEKDGEFYCDVCMTFVEYTENGLSILNHCYSNSHNTILIENSSRYLSSLDNFGKTDIDYECNNKEFRKNVTRLAKRYENIDQVAIPHFMLISYSDSRFICLLCNKQGLKFTRTGDVLNAHFSSNIHRKNMHRLNCSAMHSKTQFQVVPTSVAATFDPKLFTGYTADLEINNYSRFSNTWSPMRSPSRQSGNEGDRQARALSPAQLQEQLIQLTKAVKQMAQIQAQQQQQAAPQQQPAAACTQHYPPGFIPEDPAFDWSRLLQTPVTDFPAVELGRIQHLAAGLLAKLPQLAGRDYHDVAFVLSMASEYPNAKAQVQNCIFQRMNLLYIATHHGWPTAIAASTANAATAIFPPGFSVAQQQTPPSRGRTYQRQPQQPQQEQGQQPGRLRDQQEQQPQQQQRNNRRYRRNQRLNNPK